mmetsp:Transcript_5053/g.16179  ORF Transcript_5053/g.16179 Transcript_5053/m.16179 type:complete len:206 (+) Transcript_5053:180-797(+)
MVSIGFGNVREQIECRPKVLDLERIRRGRVFSLDEEKREKVWRVRFESDDAVRGGGGVHGEDEEEEEKRRGKRGRIRRRRGGRGKRRRGNESVRGEGRDFVEGVFQLERSGGVRVDDEDDWWRGRGEGDREDVVHEAGVREDVCGNAGDVCGENERVLRGVISRGLTRGKGGHHLRGNSHIANIATTTTTATTTTAITTRVRALT